MPFLRISCAEIDLLSFYFATVGYFVSLTVIDALAESRGYLERLCFVCLLACLFVGLLACFFFLIEGSLIHVICFRVHSARGSLLLELGALWLHFDRTKKWLSQRFQSMANSGVRLSTCKQHILGDSCGLSKKHSLLVDI